MSCETFYPSQSCSNTDLLIFQARIDQGLENIREELGRGRMREVDTSEVLRDKVNINKLSQWLMKYVIKEEVSEMKKLG